MKPVFRLIDDGRSRRIDHFIGNDHISSDRQAVHKNRIVGASHLRGIDYPVIAKLRPIFDVVVHSAVKAACTPAFGINGFDIIERGSDIVGDLYATAICGGLILDLSDQVGVEIVSGRMVVTTLA